MMQGIGAWSCSNSMCQTLLEVVDGRWAGVGESRGQEEGERKNGGWNVK